MTKRPPDWQETWQAVLGVLGQLLEKPEWLIAFRALARLLEERGIEFYSPGGSPQRRVSVLITHALYGAFPEPELERLLDDPTVAEALKPFIEEVRKRLGDGRTPASDI